MRKIEVLYEDNHLVVVNKRPGDIVQGDRTGDTPLSEHVAQYIKKKYQKPGEAFIGVPHRIDRPVSGVMVFCRTSKALSRMNLLFQQKEVQKTYWAVVKNKPVRNADQLVHYLVKNQARNKSMAYAHEVKGAKKSVLDFKVLLALRTHYLLEVLPLTGRHHQIRVQLSSMGCPIKGDVKYGYDRTNRDASIHLHARQIEFLHPVKKERMSIVAPPPKDPVWDACVKELVD